MGSITDKGQWYNGNDTSTGLALVQYAAHVLGISATAITHQITGPRIPEHHASKATMRFIGVDERRQLGRRNVRLRVRHGSLRSGEEAHEDLGALAGPRADLLAPRIVIDVGVGRAGRVVVELDPEHVEGGVVDQIAHVGLGHEALRRAGDLVLFLRVLREERAQLVDHVLEVLVVVVVVDAFDVEVEAVDDLLPERSVGAFAAAVAVPEALGDLLAFLLAGDGSFAIGAPEPRKDLFACLLAGLDVLLEVRTR